MVYLALAEHTIPVDTLLQTIQRTTQFLNTKITLEGQQRINLVQRQLINEPIFVDANVICFDQVQEQTPQDLFPHHPLTFLHGILLVPYYGTLAAPLMRCRRLCSQTIALTQLKTTKVQVNVNILLSSR